MPRLAIPISRASRCSRSPPATTPTTTNRAPTNTYAPTADVHVDASDLAYREFGEDPVFWRTIDDFKTLRANMPYFVVIRVTGGYAEPALRVRAEKADGTIGACRLRCRRRHPDRLGRRGAYFPTNITLPSPGEWTIYVDTGDEQVSLDVTALP